MHKIKKFYDNVTNKSGQKFECKKLLITSAQIAKTLEILGVDDITQADEYYYKLTLFGKNMMQSTLIWATSAELLFTKKIHLFK